MYRRYLCRTTKPGGSTRLHPTATPTVYLRDSQSSTAGKLLLFSLYTGSRFQVPTFPNTMPDNRPPVALANWIAGLDRCGVPNGAFQGLLDQAVVDLGGEDYADLP